MDRESLLITVSSFFETESHKLILDQFGNQKLTVESWERITKILSMIKFPEEKPISSDYGNLDCYTSSSALIEIDESKANRLIENIYEFTFTNFYPQIIIRLNLTRPDSQAFRFVVENRGGMKKKLSPYGYTAMKVWMNFYYGIIAREDSKIGELVTGTAKGIMQRIVVSAGSDMIYADTDTVFLTNSKNLTNDNTKIMAIEKFATYIGLPFEIEKYAGGIFNAKKKYVLFKSMENVTVKGFKKINFGN